MSTVAFRVWILEASPLMISISCCLSASFKTAVLTLRWTEWERNKIYLHTDMQLMHAALQPDAASRLEGRGFYEFSHTKYFDEKLARFSLASWWSGELHVVDAEVEIHLPAVAWR